MDTRARQILHPHAAPSLACPPPPQHLSPTCPPPYICAWVFACAWCSCSRSAVFSASTCAACRCTAERVAGCACIAALRRGHRRQEGGGVQGLGGSRAGPTQARSSSYMGGAAGNQDPEYSLEFIICKGGRDTGWQVVALPPLPPPTCKSPSSRRRPSRDSLCFFPSLPQLLQPAQ